MNPHDTKESKNNMHRTGGSIGFEILSDLIMML